MNKMNGIVKGSYSLGVKIIQGIILQIYFFLFTLRGGILLGIFPSLSAVCSNIYRTFINKEVDKTMSTFKRDYQDNFKLSNQVGYTFLGVGLLVAFDLQVSSLYLKQPLVHFILILLLLLLLGTSLFIFPSISRYQLSYSQQIRQAFILFFSNLVESGAILISFFVVIFICVTFPILLVVAGVPLVMLPIVWFALQAMKKSEEKVNDSHGEI